MCYICTDLAALLESREYFCREIRILESFNLLETLAFCIATTAIVVHFLMFHHLCNIHDISFQARILDAFNCETLLFALFDDHYL